MYSGTVSYLYTVLVYYCLSLLVSIFLVISIIKYSNLKYLLHVPPRFVNYYNVLIYLWLLLLIYRFHSCFSMSTSDISHISLPRFTMCSFNFLKPQTSKVLHLVYFQQNTISNCPTKSSDSIESTPSCRHFGLLLCVASA